MSVSVQLGSGGVAILLLSGMGWAGWAGASAQIYLNTNVSSSTCEFSAREGPALSVGSYTLSEFRRHGGNVTGADVVTLHFPDVRCRAFLLGAENPLVLTVNGPVARGANAQAWGSQYEDMAYGIRLRYQQGKRFSSTALSPASNRLVIHRTDWYGYPDDDVSVVMRPEVLSWDYSRVGRGTALAVPLTFSVSYR